MPIYSPRHILQVLDLRCLELEFFVLHTAARVRDRVWVRGGWAGLCDCDGKGVLKCDVLWYSAVV